MHVTVVCQWVQVLFQVAGLPELAHVCNTTYEIEVNNQGTDMLMPQWCWSKLHGHWMHYHVYMTATTYTYMYMHTCTTSTLGRVHL